MCVCVCACAHAHARAFNPGIKGKIMAHLLYLGHQKMSKCDLNKIIAILKYRSIGIPDGMLSWLTSFQFITQEEV